MWWTALTRAREGLRVIRDNVVVYEGKLVVPSLQGERP